MTPSAHVTTPAHWRWPLKLGAITLATLSFILTTSMLDGGAGIALHALRNVPVWAPAWRMFANSLPGLLLALALLALTRKVVLAFVLALATEALVYVVNALKMANLGAPLMPADLQMIGQIGSGGGELINGYLPPSIWLYPLALITVVLLLMRYEPPLLQRHVRSRLLVGAAAITLIGTLLGGLSAWSLVYSHGRLGMQPWSAKATARHSGLFSTLMLFHLQYNAEKDKPDINDALQMMANYTPALRQQEASKAPTNDSRPDIVVLLSESFFDPTTLNGYPKNIDFMPNLHRLAQHGSAGEMHAPTFGGGTIRTEFEVLTGLPLRYFPDIQFPYLQIHAKVIPGIVHLLKRHGYETLAVHGNDPNFWSRSTAFKALGFDKFIAQASFPTNDAVHDGKYMSDKSFTDELLRQLKPDGPPRFVLAISIEAHGPYNRDYGIDSKLRDTIPVPPKVTGRAKVALQNYIYHIRHADQQLGRLADTLTQRKRPTLIVFFGDHLPAIIPAFQQAGFRNGKGFLVQTVPYLLIDTAKLHSAEPVRKNVAAWELPGMLLAHTSIHDPYFTLTELVAPQLAVLTRAPDAPPPKEDVTQTRMDKGMINIAQLRLKNQLNRWWPKAAAMAMQAPQTVPATGQSMMTTAAPLQSEATQADHP